MNDEVGVIYMLHFDEAIGDVTRPRMMARHYVGWASDGKLEDRLQEHGNGKGAAINPVGCRARDRLDGCHATGRDTDARETDEEQRSP